MTKHPLAPSGLTCRPRLLPLPTSEQSLAETLQAMEVRWVASMQASSRGTARLSSEMSASLPAWMTPSQTPRMHWSDRRQQRQEQHQQQTQQQPAPQLPLERAATDDIIDVLEACGSHAQQAQWRHIIFIIIFFGRERYSLHEATITTSKKRDVHGGTFGSWLALPT